HITFWPEARHAEAVELEITLARTGDALWRVGGDDHLVSAPDRLLHAVYLHGPLAYPDDVTLGDAQKLVQLCRHTRFYPRNGKRRFGRSRIVQELRDVAAFRGPELFGTLRRDVPLRRHEIVLLDEISKTHLP